LTPKNFGQTRQAPSSSTVSSPKTTRRLVRHATLCSPEQLADAGYQASDLPLVKPQSPQQKARVKME
jgi:hypothetical protein